MGDYTSFQVTIHQCPPEQQTAAARVLGELQIEWGSGKQPAPRYEVTDNTRNPDGEPIRRGDDALIIGNFRKRKNAERHIAGQPGADDPDRYSIDEVPGLALEPAQYTEHEISCGSADEYYAALKEAAPGSSFTLWEDPKYEWLGTLCAYTPELGLFSADCDANGIPVFDARQIAKMVTDAGEGATASQVRAAIYRATGGPWLDPHDAPEAKPAPDVLGELLSAADDYEHVTIEEVARKAGILWQCQAYPDGNFCGWDNRADEATCGGCGAPKPTEGEATP